MTFQEKTARLSELLAKDYSCAPEDLLKTETVITEAKLIEGRRRYSEEAFFFGMVSTGNNAVISANPALHDFLREWSREKVWYRLFEPDSLYPLENELRKYGRTLSHGHLMYLPRDNVEIRADCEIKRLSESEIHGFYGDGRFKNAIAYPKPFPPRPDVAACCAYVDGKLAGMAGASEDATGWLQIGIDVLPEYRGRCIGAALVNALKNDIESSGKIPFYGHSFTNIFSHNTAVKCGFHCSWTEIYDEEIKRERGAQ